MYKCMGRVLKGDAKAEFTQETNLVVSCNVEIFTIVVGTMTVRIFPKHAYQDHESYTQGYESTHLSINLFWFSLDMEQMIAPDDDVKEILYHVILNSPRKKMTKQGYNYLDSTIQEISGLYETYTENLEA